MATDYSKFTVQQLKNALSEKGLDQSGKKADLVARLNAANEPAKDQAAEATGVEERVAAVDDATAETEDMAESEGDEAAEQEEDDTEQTAEENGEDELEEEPTEVQEDADEEQVDAEEEQVEKENEVDEEEQDEEQEEQENEDEDKEDPAQKSNLFDDVEVDEKEADTSGTADAEKGEENKSTPKAQKKRRWVKVAVGKFAKFNSLDCVRNFTIPKKQQDIQESRNKRRFRVFPVTLEEYNNHVFKEITEKSSNVSVNFNKTLTGKSDVKLTGMVNVAMDRACDVADAVKKLKELNPEYQISTSGNANRAKGDFHKFRTQSEKDPDETTLLIPRLPDRITEDDLWEMFPTAWEINLCPSPSAEQKRTQPGTKVTPRKHHPSYAYIYFPNMDVSRKCTMTLGSKDKPSDIEELILIPIRSLTQQGKSAAKGAKPVAPVAKQTSIFSAQPIEVTVPGKKAGTSGPKTQVVRQTGKGKSFPNTTVDKRGFQPNRNQQNRPTNQSPRGSGQKFQRSGFNQQGHSRQGPSNYGNQGRFRAQQDQAPSLMSTQPMTPDKEQGLQVLGSLLTSLGNQPNQANALLNFLGQTGQQQPQQQRGNYTGQSQQRYQQQNRSRTQQQQQSQRSASKRTRSPAMSDMGFKRGRFEGSSYQSPSQMSSNMYGSGSGYGNQSSSSATAYSGAGDQPSNMYESLDVVSRIVRASRELKDAMNKGKYSGGYSDELPPGGTGYSQSSYGQSSGSYGRY